MIPSNPVSQLGLPRVLEVRQVTLDTTGAALAAITQTTAGTKPDADSNGGEPKVVAQVWLQADPGNSTNNVLLGTDSGSAKFALTVGVTIGPIALSDLTQLYAKASANTPKLNILILGA